MSNFQSLQVRKHQNASVKLSNNQINQNVTVSSCQCQHFKHTNKNVQIFISKCLLEVNKIRILTKRQRFSLFSLSTSKYQNENYQFKCIQVSKCQSFRILLQEFQREHVKVSKGQNVNIQMTQKCQSIKKWDLTKIAPIC